jgi:hypothetical protein
MAILSDCADIFAVVISKFLGMYLCRSQVQLRYLVCGSDRTAQYLPLIVVVLSAQRPAKKGKELTSRRGYGTFYFQ